MINFKNIEIKYGDFTAIENLNLTIADGEFFTFLGPSGCGKTTTLRALVGFLNPTGGEILVDGKNILEVPVEKRGIGMVFQSYALFPTMTVYENLAFGLKVKKMSKSEIDQKVKNVAKVIEIKDQSCPAASSKESRLPGQSYWSQRSCVWMSRFPIWMQSCASACAES